MKLVLRKSNIKIPICRRDFLFADYWICKYARGVARAILFFYFADYGNFARVNSDGCRAYSDN